MAKIEVLVDVMTNQTNENYYVNFQAINHFEQSSVDECVTKMVERNTPNILTEEMLSNDGYVLKQDKFKCLIDTIDLSLTRLKKE
ncbi:hypothetical protein [Haemophilus parainfluenzae]|jgi:hypothetical protein|uniref:hypothetical protein n=1 Tax=Haemophilus parainfluenzae TaxID=729 RepID=UPI0018A4C397|nr:hypothetical protein [Haemophilus parainfluenzae]QOR08414.1 hypothetical protein INP99_02050 [Haemophilus parainfluenzae]